MKPLRDGCNSLKVISGYATSAMAFKHLGQALSLVPKLKIQLIIGMSNFDGLSLSNHCGFNKLVTEDFAGALTCSYVFQNKPVHSKAYIWLKDDHFETAFVGSANYTQTAFLGSNRELLAVANDESLIGYFNEIERDSIFCDSPETEQLIQIYRDVNYRSKIRKQDEIDNTDRVFQEERINLEHVKVSFLARDGSLPAISGLNWGQRGRRKKNEAYIRLESKISRSSFFPPSTVHFTINTDDNKTLIATRAQSNGKAIHTPHNNGLIGEYFRMRLGLPNGAFISKEDLERYGRTDIDFYKIDDETYYMDFSVV